MKNDAFMKTVDTIASDCLAVRIRLLNRTVTNIFDDALRPLGVRVSQLNVLIVVAKRGAVSPGDVARRLNIEKSTLSRNIERMRTRGWLKVSQGDSGHTQLVELEPAGRLLIEKAMPLWNIAQEEAEAALGRRGAQSIRHAANTVWARLGGE